MTDTAVDDIADEPDFTTEESSETVYDNNSVPFTIAVSEDVVRVKKSGHSMGSNTSRRVIATRVALTSHAGTVRLTTEGAFEISIPGKTTVTISRSK